MKPKKDNQEPLLNVGDVNLASREPVSATLRRHRKQLGQDLKTVAEALRIRYVYLEAIEQGRYDALPGPTYALGFIKTYAEYLNLDEDEIVQRFRDDVDGLDDQTQLVFPSPVPEGKVPGGAILMVALLMGSMAYGGWHYLSNRGSGFADFIPALPDRLQALFEGEMQTTPESELAVVAGTEGAGTDGAGASAAEIADNSDSSQSETVVSKADAPQETDSPAEPVAATQSAPDASVSDTANTLQASSETPAAPSAPQVSSPAVTSTPTTAPAEVQGIAAENSSTQVAQTQAAQTADGAATEPQISAIAGSAAGVATLAAPLERDGANSPTATTSVDATAGSETTVISSQAVTNQVATSDIPSAEIPAAPAAPVTTQLVSVPDATQPQVYGEDNANARIILRATQDAWVQVRDSADELLLTRVLREGDVYRVPDQEGLTLLTGNAGGIDVLVDGTLLAPLGPVGSVRRDLALDPQVLLAGTTSQ